MQARGGHGRRRTALIAVLSVGGLAASTAASAADGVVWQGRTPKNGTARVAGQSAFAESISLRVHVGRRPTRTFRLSSARGALAERDAAPRRRRAR
jgi:hypothetical protein